MNRSDQIILFGTTLDGLYTSDDLGVTWKQQAFLRSDGSVAYPPDHYVYDVQVSPTDAHAIYVTTLDSSTPVSTTCRAQGKVCKSIPRKGYASIEVISFPHLHIL